MIHLRACVDSDCTIGDRTRIWQFASVIRGAVLGDDCNVGSNAIVDAAVLGNECLIGHGASVHPGFMAGHGVFIGPGAVLCNDRWPSTSKDGFDLKALLTGDRYTIVAEDGAVIGANAVVLPGVRLGKGCIVAAGSVCATDVPAGYVHYRSGALAPKPANRERMRWAS